MAYRWLSYNDKMLTAPSGKIVHRPAHSIIGGKEYKIVDIDGKTWMAENLDYKFDGLTIGESGTSRTEPRANYYNNDESTYGVNGNKYGLLYNWAAVKYLNDNRASLIPGWHVPTNEEWEELVTAAGYDPAVKLKSTSGWLSHNPSSGGNGSDAYGFSAFPAGYYDGSFNEVNYLTQFWTASEVNVIYAYWRYIDSEPGLGPSGYTVGATVNYKYFQNSVRLVKDSV